jgi:hypothetical protein
MYPGTARLAKKELQRKHLPNFYWMVWGQAGGDPAEIKRIYEECTFLDVVRAFSVDMYYNSYNG